MQLTNPQTLHSSESSLGDDKYYVLRPNRQAPVDDNEQVSVTWGSPREMNTSEMCPFVSVP